MTPSIIVLTCVPIHRICMLSLFSRVLSISSLEEGVHGEILWVRALPRMILSIRATLAFMPHCSSSLAIALDTFSSGLSNIRAAVTKSSREQEMSSTVSMRSIHSDLLIVCSIGLKNLF